MKTIKILVKNNVACLYGRVDLIAGTVGQSCQFYFDKEWDLLQKKITYKVGSTILGTYAIDNNKATIPAKVLMTAGLPLEIGITGYTLDNSVITPTSWCFIGNIQNGAIASNGNNNDDIIYDGGTIITPSSNNNIQYDGGVIL